MPSQSSSTSSRGIAPHFNQDVAGVLVLYHSHIITHDEMRKIVSDRFDLELGEWPDGLPKPHLYKLWQPEGFPDLDDEDAPDQEFYLPDIHASKEAVTP